MLLAHSTPAVINHYHHFVWWWIQIITPPLHLMVDPNYVPVAHYTPVPVPFHWQEEVKAGIDQDIRHAVIEPVPIGEPITWCHRMVICNKKNGSPRKTVDFEALNAIASRETHHTTSPFHQAQSRSVPRNKKTIFYCWNGYHNIPLHADDQHLPTFISPWGHFCYKVVPPGYIASGDGYMQCFDEIISAVLDMTKCIGDTLLWSDNLESSFFPHSGPAGFVWTQWHHPPSSEISIRTRYSHLCKVRNSQ